MGWESFVQTVVPYSIEVIYLLFCRHKYIVLSMPKVYTVYTDGSRSKSPTEFLVVQRCEKCGKIKQTKVRS